MSLTDEQTLLVRNWMKSRGVRGTCPGCGNRGWTINGLVPMPVTTVLGIETQGLPTLQAQTLPVVVTTCKDCGYMMQFSAVMMGIR